jgi:cytochrome c551/c552
MCRDHFPNPGDFMTRTLLVAACAAALLASAGPVLAADAPEALLKDLDCVKCHTLTTKKKGPAYKTSAADWKKAGLTADKGLAAMKEKHDDIKGTDAQLKSLAAWVLTQ